jgi:hypothetical protein
MKYHTTPGQSKRPTALGQRVFAAIVLTLFLAVPGLSAAVIDIGNGAQTYHFVLESPNVGVRQYAVHLDGATDAYDLIYAVLAEDTAISMGILNFGTSEQPSYFINSVTYNGVTEANTASSPWIPSWGQWVSGGQSAQWDSEGNMTITPAPPGTWRSGGGVSSPYRAVEPGSWDALVYGDASTPPSVAPVPEPSVALLFGAGLLAIVRRRRA